MPRGRRFYIASVRPQARVRDTRRDLLLTLTEVFVMDDKWVNVAVDSMNQT